MILPELGDRGATPVFKHMQIGLTFILAENKKRENQPFLHV